MGADAHGTASLGHRQSHGQRLFPARQMNGMLPHPGAGQNVLAAGQAGGGTGAGVGKDLPGRACRSTSPLSITIISLHRR